MSRPEITGTSPAAPAGGRKPPPDSRRRLPAGGGRPPGGGKRENPRAQSRRATLSLAITLQVVISAGDGLAMIALANRVFQSSHASWAVAAVFLAVCVPITALAPLAGVLLDRFPARPVLVTTALAEALVLGCGQTLASS